MFLGLKDMECCWQEDNLPEPEDTWTAMAEGDMARMMEDIEIVDVARAVRKD